MNGEEIDKTTTKSTTKTTISGAEYLVRTVGERIGLAQKDPLRLNLICSKLQEEHIYDEIQLTSLDSLQWKELDAPIGLATAVRALASAVVAVETQTTPQHEIVAAPTDPLPSLVSSSCEVLKSSEHSTTRIVTAEKSTHQPPSVMNLKDRLSVVGRLRSFSPNSQSNELDVADVSDAPVTSTKQTAAMVETIDEETVDEEMAVPQIQQQENQNKNIETNDISSCSKHNIKPPTTSQIDKPPSSGWELARAYREYFKGENCFTTFMSGQPYSMTIPFQRALLHSKTGSELKAHTVFIMELNLLAAALFLGAGVELWASFPETSNIPPEDDNEAYVPPNLAIVFHFVAMLNLMFQLAATSGWIWSIHVTSAVSPNKFHEYYVQTRYVLDRLLFFSEHGQMMLIMTMSLLFAANIASVSNNAVLRNVVYYVPIVLAVIGCRFVHTLSSFAGRVACHGLLLMDNDPTTVLSNISKQMNCKNSEKVEANEEANCEGRASAEVEINIGKHFCKHNILSEGIALDAYCKAKDTTLVEGGNKANDFSGRGYSILDVIFPDFGGTIRTSTSSTTPTRSEVDQQTPTVNPDS